MYIDRYIASCSLNLRSLCMYDYKSILFLIAKCIAILYCSKLLMAYDFHKLHRNHKNIFCEIFLIVEDLTLQNHIGIIITGKITKNWSYAYSV